jgi:hypothetical protein
MYIIKSTYTSKMYNHFIFKYVKSRQRRKDERIKKENGTHEHSPFILETSLIAFLFPRQHYLGEWG